MFQKEHIWVRTFNFELRDIRIYEFNEITYAFVLASHLIPICLARKSPIRIKSYMVKIAFCLFQYFI